MLGRLHDLVDQLAELLCELVGAFGRLALGVDVDDGRFTIEDQGSLNGTYVNRRRIESAPLEDGDEVQIGKYRLTFLVGL